MSDKLINEVLVVGGGTAGWLTAGVLAKQLNSIDPQAVQVTLIESPNIPILGVGEGTWPTMRNTLKSLGIDESEFMRECDATFKQGSEFVNWANTPEPGERDAYYHPFSAVFRSSYDFNLAPYWLLGDGPSGAAYDSAVTCQSRLCDLGCAPKKITTPSYVAIQNYSYHLNANKFASFLTRFCVERLGVQHKVANVSKVNLDDQGYIASVDTDDSVVGRLDADFFVDCSGARALLIDGALGSPWHSVSDVILNDTALAMQIPYESEDSPIATHTISTAHESGWTWDIGLHNRRGVGYVYSSRHSDDERAEQVLRDYAGPMAEGIEARKISLNLGYRPEFWRKNCVAIGMSAGFIEPLEASAIFLVEAAANMLADQFPRDRNAMSFVETKFNEMFQMRWSKSVDFIKLHYCISNRRDSQYWIDNCDPKTVPDSLQQRLDHWRTHPPSKYDFDYAYEPFSLDSYLFVLYGMKFPASLAHNRSSFHRHDLAKHLFADVEASAQQLAKELPSQRDLVEKVYAYGFQKN